MLEATALPNSLAQSISIWINKTKQRPGIAHLKIELDNGI